MTLTPDQRQTLKLVALAALAPLVPQAIFIAASIAVGALVDSGLFERLATEVLVEIEAASGAPRLHVETAEPGHEPEPTPAPKAPAPAPAPAPRAPAPRAPAPQIAAA